MTPRARRLGVGLLVVALATALGGVAIWKKSSSAPTPDAASSSSSSSAPFAESAWPKGSRTSYHVKWQSNAKASFEAHGAGALETRFEIEGDLRIDGYGVSPAAVARSENGEILLGLRWTRFDRASAEALGKPMVASSELITQLRDAETVIVIEPSGRIRELGYGNATTPLARFVQRAIALSLTAEISAAAGSLDVVDTAVGRARIARHSSDSKTTQSARSYDELDAFPDGFETAETARVDARGEVTNSQDQRLRGVVDRIASDETITIEGNVSAVQAFHSTTSLTAKLIDRTSLSASAAAEAPPFTPSIVRPSTTASGGFDGGADGRHASLERRCLGVTPDTLHADVRSAALFPRMGTTEWVWRDSAYLELHPEEAEPLITKSIPIGLTGVAAAFDIVVVSGTTVGQAALVRAMQGPAAETEVAFMELIQRLQYLKRPTLELVAYVGRERARYRGTQRGYAAEYTLGALAFNLAREESTAQTAEKMMSELATDLQNAKKGSLGLEDRLALLHALGNAGLASTTPQVVAHARDKEPEIRRAVAHALRKTEGSAIVDALQEMAVDSDPTVAGAALDSLLRKQLDEDDWNLLAHQIQEGRVHPETHPTLVNHLNRRRGDDPAHALGILQVMVDSNHVSQDVKQRVENILRE